MARLPRLCLPGIPQHVIQRDSNRQACFAAEEDFFCLCTLVGRKRKEIPGCSPCMGFYDQPLAFASNTPYTISHMMQALGRYYVGYFNYTYRRTGTLWEGRFKSCVVDAETYLLVCQRYIELNPVRAEMVDSLKEYDIVIL